MEKLNALARHDAKIAETRKLIKDSSGFIKKDAKKHLNRLLREREEYLRWQNA